MTRHDGRRHALPAAAPLAQPGRAGEAGRAGRGRPRWRSQLIALAAAFAASALAWAIVAVPLGLWATQGCFGGDPAYQTRCPDGRYLEVSLRLYAIPAMAWAACWLPPHRGWYRRARIALLTAAVAAVAAIPFIATWQAFAHMYTVGSL
jgi:hypothetical protein